MPTVAVAVIPRLVATKLTRAAFGLAISDVLRRTFDHHPAPRLVPARAALIALAIYGLGVVWYVLFALTTHLWAPPGARPLDWANVAHLSLESVILLVAWSAIYLGARAWRRAERAQLDALRSQLNPHFLFNALGSIRAMISEDPVRARAMVTGFAAMLRRSLDASATDETPLRDEIAAVEEYLAIERVRFESDLDVAIDVVPPADALSVPTFLLQPLIENAITHGRRTSPTPLRIRLHAAPYRAGVRIEVANSGILATGDRHTGLGVANVRARLSLLRPDRHRFTLTQDQEWVRAVIEIDTAP